MNPVVVARVGTPLATGVLSAALSQAHPRTALDTLRRLPRPRARQVAAALGQPGAVGVLDDHDLDDAGPFMVSQFPTSDLDHSVAAARQRLPDFEGTLYGFIHILFE